MTDIKALREFVDTDAVLLDRSVPALKASIRALLDRITALEEGLKPFGALYDQIIADHGEGWFSEDGGTMRASLSYPAAKDPVRWKAFRRASTLLKDS